MSEGGKKKRRWEVVKIRDEMFCWHIHYPFIITNNKQIVCMKSILKKYV